MPYERLPELRALSLRSGVRSPLLRLGYLKVFMDGTLGSQTAWMLDGSGIQITSGDHLAEIVTEAAAAGWPVGVHAIGVVNREALDTFERTRGAWQRAGSGSASRRAVRRAREDVSRFAELGVAISAQFSHAPSAPRSRRALFWGDRLRRHLLIPLARRLGCPRRERLGRARSRSSTPGAASSPASAATSTTARHGAPRKH